MSQNQDFDPDFDFDIDMTEISDEMSMDVDQWIERMLS